MFVCLSHLFFGHDFEPTLLAFSSDLMMWEKVCHPHEEEEYKEDDGEGEGMSLVLSLVCSLVCYFSDSSFLSI